MGLAGGGARRSGSRYRTRCAVVLRRLRLRLPRLRLRLWDRVQLSVLRLWLWDRLQLSGLHRLQLPGLWLWLWQGHCPPSSLRRRLASRLVKSRTKASRPVSAERALQARRGRAFEDGSSGFALSVASLSLANQRGSAQTGKRSAA